MSNMIDITTSTNFLKKEINNWFTKKKPQLKYQILSVTIDEIPDLNCSDIVLLGDYLSSLQYIKTKNLQFNDFTFYVLAQKSKQIIIKLFKIAPERIIVIPRYDLLASEKKGIFEERKINKKESFVFFYGGRFSPEKNVHLILWAVYFLQTKYGLNITLKLAGNNLNEIKDLSNSLTQYYQYLKNTIDNLDWTIAPILYSNLDPENWIKAFQEDDIFINLTANFMEDFSISCAQAQMNSHRLIISDIGGQSDVNTGYGIKIPYWIFTDIANSFTWNKHIEQRGHRAATYIFNHLNKLNSSFSDFHATENIFNLNSNFDKFEIFNGRDFKQFTKSEKALTFYTEYMNIWCQTTTPLRQTLIINTNSTIKSDEISKKIMILKELDESQINTLYLDKQIHREYLNHLNYSQIKNIYIIESPNSSNQCIEDILKLPISEVDKLQVISTLTLVKKSVIIDRLKSNNIKFELYLDSFYEKSTTIT